ncbi:MAG: hypothetical protein AB1652_07785 [Bacillota bacterium]
MIQQSARYAQMAGQNITETDIRERYAEYMQRHGQEKAVVALKNTLTSFKECARREEDRLFSLLRAECLQKFGFAPANRRTFKAEIRENPNRFNTPAAQEYKRRFMK